MRIDRPGDFGFGLRGSLPAIVVLYMKVYFFNKMAPTGNPFSEQARGGFADSAACARDDDDLGFGS